MSARIVKWIKKNIYWEILIFFCVIGGTIQLISCYDSFWNPEIKNLIMNNPFVMSPLPAFTFCNMMSYDMSKLKKFGLNYTDKFLGHRAPYTWGWEEMKSIENFTAIMIGTVNDYTIEPFQEYRERLVYEETYFAKFGKCITYTFKSGSDDIHSVGFTFMAPADHRNIIQTVQREYFENISNDSIQKPKSSYFRIDGWLVYVHNKEEPFNELSLRAIYRENVKLIMDEVMSISLTAINFTLVNQRAHPCIQSRTYSKIKCGIECRSKKLVKQYNCTGPFMIPQPGYSDCKDPKIIKDLLYMMQNSIRAYKELGCNCPRSCSIVDFELTIIERFKIPQPLNSNRPVISKLAVKLNRDKLQLVLESIEYDFNSLIADIGGTVGFFLGLSVLSITVPLQLLYSKCVRRYCQKYVILRQLESAADEVIDLKNTLKLSDGKYDWKHQPLRRPKVLSFQYKSVCNDERKLL